jgi:hypothetical protein
MYSKAVTSPTGGLTLTATESTVVVTGNSLSLVANAGAGDIAVTGIVVPVGANTYPLGTAANPFSITHTNSVKFYSGSTLKQETTPNGVIHWAASISSGGSVVYQYTSNNSVTVTRPGSNVYRLTFANALPATQCVFFATVADPPVAGETIQGQQTSTTVIDVVITDTGGVRRDLRFNFMILGTGF